MSGFRASDISLHHFLNLYFFLVYIYISSVKQARSWNLVMAHKIRNLNELMQTKKSVCTADSFI